MAITELQPFDQSSQGDHLPASATKVQGPSEVPNDSSSAAKANQAKGVSRHTGNLLRAAVSVGLVSYLITKVGWETLMDVLRLADPSLLVTYVALGLSSVFISAAKWRVLCGAVGIPASLLRLFVLYLVGGFFNHVLPTSMGGDVVRGLELGRFGGKSALAMASVFVERFTGLTALLLFAVLGVAFDPRFHSDGRILLLLSLLLVGYAVGTWVVFHPALVQVMNGWFTQGVVAKVMTKVTSFQLAIHAYRNHRTALVWSMMLSLVFYATAVLNTYVGCRMLGHPVEISSLLAAVPIMLVLFMLPISLGGIGLQEWACMFALSLVGVPPPVGLCLALVRRARSIGIGMLGGVAYPLIASGPARLSPRSVSAQGG